MNNTLELKTRCGLPARISTQLVDVAGFALQGTIEDPPKRVHPHLWRRGGWWLEPDAMGLDVPHGNDLLGVPAHELTPVGALS